MKRPICLITDSLDRRRGGAEGHLADLARSFVRAGHPMRVWVRRPGGCPAELVPHVETLPTWTSRGPLLDSRLSHLLQRRFAETDGIVFSTLPVNLPQMTHYFAPGGLYRSGFEAERESFEPGLRRRFYRLGNRLNRLRQRWIAGQERLLTRATPPQVLTLSAAARLQMLTRLHLPAENVVTIPSGVDLNVFCPDPGPTPRAKRLRLLFVAHNFRLKGLHCLLRALQCAAQRGLQAELTVAGGGAHGALGALSGRLGLAQQVHFLGPVAAAELGALYRRSDALVHPTFADHCSLAVLEALASGLPVVTTRRNGAAERMESGRHGFILDDPRDIEAFVAALLGLQDQEQLDRMRDAALALRPQLDFAAHARHVLAWLNGEQGNWQEW